MNVQYITDENGNQKAVIIPIEEWNNITAKHQDVKELTEEKSIKLNDVSRFKGILTNDEADKYHQYLKKARNEWDRDI
jgi:hypothetical protein